MRFLFRQLLRRQLISPLIRVFQRVTQEQRVQRADSPQSEMVQTQRNVEIIGPPSDSEILVISSGGEECFFANGDAAADPGAVESNEGLQVSMSEYVFNKSKIWSGE